MGSKVRVVATAAVVLVVAVGAVFTYRWFTGDDSYLTHPVPPPKLALMDPLPRAQPKPGWQLTKADVVPGAASMGAAIGVVNNRAYFRASSGARSAQSPDRSWVYGVDANTGKSLFPAVEIPAGDTKCYLNGPARLLCTGRDYAWVIDALSGKVTHQGAVAGGYEFIEQVGHYAVGRTLGEGWWGIGVNAERTWRIPGNGASPLATGVPTLPVPTLAAASPADISAQSIIFDVTDGHVVTPDAGTAPDIYPGGFAIDDNHSNALKFYDSDNNRTNTFTGPKLSLLTTISARRSEATIAHLYAQTRDQWLIFDHTGRLYAALDTPKNIEPNDTIQILGGRLLVRNQAGSLTQYDMKTGAPLSNCPNLNPFQFIGTDGNVFVMQPGDGYNISAEGDPHAIDIDTCEVLWKIGKNNGTLINAAGKLLQVGTAEITSLVA